jgi:hypothetical protein
MGVANTLAYYDTAKITTVKSFIVPVPAVETYDKDLRKRFEKK